MSAISVDLHSLREIMENTSLDWDRVLGSARWIHEGDLISPGEGNRRFDTIRSLGGIWWSRMSGIIDQEIDRLRSLEERDGS